MVGLHWLARNVARFRTVTVNYCSAAQLYTWHDVADMTVWHIRMTIRPHLPRFHCFNRTLARFGFAPVIYCFTAPPLATTWLTGWCDSQATNRLHVPSIVSRAKSHACIDIYRDVLFHVPTSGHDVVGMQTCDT